QVLQLLLQVRDLGVLHRNQALILRADVLELLDARLQLGGLLFAARERFLGAREFGLDLGRGILSGSAGLAGTVGRGVALVRARRHERQTFLLGRLAFALCRLRGFRRRLRRGAGLGDQRRRGNRRLAGPRFVLAADLIGDFTPAAVRL